MRSIVLFCLLVILVSSMANEESHEKRFFRLLLKSNTRSEPIRFNPNESNENVAFNFYMDLMKQLGHVK